jgi:hypothetical protein
LSGNQINRQSGQFFREGQDAANIPIGIARGDREIATLDVPLSGKSGAECFEQPLELSFVESEAVLAR